MATRTQFVDAGPIQWLEPVLEEWCKVLLQFCHEFDWLDVPWWYGERTAVGLFAAALTRDRWMVLEEYSTQKADISSSPLMRQVRRDGRQDLLAVKKPWSFVAEAKNDWTRVPRKSGTLKSHLCGLLHRATCDAIAKESYGSTQAAIVFSSPKIHRSDDVAAAKSEWCEGISELDDCARAWVLPKRAARFPEGTESDDNTAGWRKFVFPGTAVIVRECSAGDRMPDA